MNVSRANVQTHARCELLDITSTVQAMVEKSAVHSGLVVVFVPHTTAAITINENADPDVQHDLLLKLSKLIPEAESGYKHSEGNSDAHLKTSLVGNSVTVLVEAGRLVLGRWQGIYFCEFDGPRQREFMVKFIQG